MIEIDDNIVAKRVAGGAWKLRDMARRCESRELFVTERVLRKAYEFGYFNWEPDEVQNVALEGQSD